MVGPGQGSSTWSTEALRRFHLWRAACDVSLVGWGLICSLQRGLISGEMLQVNSACREGRSVPRKSFYRETVAGSTSHENCERVVCCRSVFLPEVACSEAWPRSISSALVMFYSLMVASRFAASIALTALMDAEWGG